MDIEYDDFDGYFSSKTIIIIVDSVFIHFILLVIVKMIEKYKEKDEGLWNGSKRFIVYNKSAVNPFPITSTNEKPIIDAENFDINIKIMLATTIITIIIMNIIIMIITILIIIIISLIIMITIVILLILLIVILIIL